MKLLQLNLRMLALVVIAFATAARAQTPTPTPAPGAAAPPQAAPAANPADVATMDATVAALYDVISGPAGKRDWDRFRSLFIPGARLIPTNPRPTGEVGSSRKGRRETISARHQQHPVNERRQALVGGNDFLAGRGRKESAARGVS